MPTINNATVATGTGLSVAGNGGRKLIRLNNGNQYVIARNGAVLNLYKTTDNWTTQTTYSLTQVFPVIDASIATDGTRLWVIANYTNQIMRVYNISDSTPSFASYTEIEPNTQSAFGNNTIIINSAGTEIHAAWSSKNSTYSSSFNIRYAKGTIAADGSVTWGAVEQVTKVNASSQDLKNPSIIIKDTIPMIVFDSPVLITTSGLGTYANTITVLKRDSTLSSNTSSVSSPWTFKVLYNANNASYLQSFSVFLFVPQSINGLIDGRLWVAWQGTDFTDSSRFNIRTSFSDDGGVTWSTPVKQTTGNLYDQTNSSLTADSQGKVLLTWDAQNATTTQTALKVFNGTWGATTTLTGDGYTNASTLSDNAFKLSMTTPPIIRQSTSGVYFSGAYFTGASVSPASSALGDKTASSVLSYTVTPESGSTVTSIVEKVNGTTVNTYSNPASLSRTFTIPLANWDALKYWNTHTISVTVTDSNGMANTQTYTFVKTLANDASVLEGTKSAKDGKDRISTKRDALATQVGLPTGSTFDAISAAITSNLKKTASGTVNSSSSNVSFVDSNGTTQNYKAITVSGIGFTPSAIMVYQSSNGDPACSINTNALVDPNGFKLILRNANGGSTGYAVRLTGNAYIANGTFQMPVSNGLGNTPHYWFAIE